MHKDRPVTIRIVMGWSLPVVLLAAALAGGGWWLARAAAPQPPRLPGMDGAPRQDGPAAEGAAKVIRGMPLDARLATGRGRPSTIAGEWPCFRGAARDNVCPDPTPLARNWPAAGPPVLWNIALGQGHAGAAVAGGLVFVFDYDEAGQRDVIRALSLDDAAEVWSYSYPMAIKPNHGISRTVPAVAGGFLVGLGPRCQVTCLDAATGAFRWRLDPVRQFGTKEPGWYAGQCPLIDRGRAIIAPAGKDVLLMAVQLDGGQVLWTAPNALGSQMSHASVVPMEFEGARMFVYAGTNGVAGVSAEDGAVLWQSREFKWHTIAPSPLPLPGGRILFTAGYGCKAVLARLARKDGALVLEVLKTAAPQVFGAEQHTPVLFQDHIYALLPKPRQELVCADLDLKEVWASGRTERFGIGPALVAGGRIFIMDDEGVLSMAEASPAGYALLARHKVLPGPDSWGPMAMVRGRLILRDQFRMACLDLRAPAEERRE